MATNELAPEAAAPNPYAAPTELGTEGTAPLTAAALARLATRGSRFVASMVDGLLYGAAMIPGMIVGALLVGGKSQEETFRALGFGAFSTALLYFYQCYLVSTQGQSLAKRWCHIRIVRQNGEPAGFLHGVLLRSWLMGLFASIPYVGKVISLLDCLFIFQADQRCLHDRLAGTIVIEA